MKQEVKQEVKQEAKREAKQGVKRVLILAGGTGGHIIPALAVAKTLAENEISIEWLGSKHGLESTLVPAQGINIHYIKVSGIRGKGRLQLLLAPFRILKAVIQSIQVIKKVKPDVVIGFGGYVSGPGGLAAKLTRVPLVIHEQNAVAGMTNRYLAKLSKKVFQAFPNTFAPKHNAQTIGNPVRADIITLDEPQIRMQQHDDALHVLILGGSQGAVALNQILPQAIAEIKSEIRPQVWHACGRKHVASVTQTYRDLDVDARVDAFIDEMTAAYKWADLVICRSGALTVAELAVAGLASVLIPFPAAVDDHQTKNARFLVDVGAAILIPQQQATTEKIEQVLLDFINDKERLVMMANAARSVRMIDASNKISKYIRETL